MRNLEIDQLGTRVIGLAIEVHKELGAGLLESSCEKAVAQLLPIHEAQIITYLKQSNLKLGYLINFNVQLLKDGIKRKIIN